MSETSENPLPTRRTFLKTVAGAIAVAGLGGVLVSDRGEQEQLNVQVIDGNKLFVNKEGLPVKVETRDGKVVTFVTSEMKSLQERAIVNKELEVAGVVDVTNSFKKPDVHVGSEEHPRIMEPAPDRMTDEELNEKGITIIQPEKTKLHIRKGAFEPGMPLSEFSDGKRKLTIAFVDGPYLVQELFNDSKYDSVRSAIKSEGSHITEGRMNVQGKDVPFTQDPSVLDILRTELITESQKLLEDERARKPDDGHFVLLHKTNLAALKNGTYTDSDIAFFKGVHVFFQGLYHEQAYNEDQSVVFLAVAPTGTRDIFSVYFDENGTVQAHSFTDNQTLASYNHGATVRPDGVYPDGSKPIKGHSEVGWNLRHELNHDQHQDNDQVGYNEEEINRLTGEELANAKRQWIESGYGKNDPNGDNGYCFEWDVPQSAGGGYIRT